jgi:DMSO/TMAO reductase YedYZ molybdopterin-dependent catalytic subunit
MIDPSRRDFIASATVAAALGSSTEAAPGGADDPFPGLITRSHSPQNLEFPFPALDGFVTPSEQFYVRNHFAVPTLDPGAWRLKVEGAVARPAEFTLAALRELPSRTTTLTLECAGNGRVFLTPPAPGVQWGLGAVGNARWTGVPLAAVLDKVGVKDGAVDVVLEGADRGTIATLPSSPGPIAFARSLPLAKAKQPEVLLAWAMNGADLTADHGAPLRAVVGGWYGMASVKWLTRIVVTDRPFQGFFQTLDYSYWERRDGLPDLRPIGALKVKASIARPAHNDAVAAGAEVRVLGAAWSGEGDVTKVEVTDDGGTTWKEAKLLGEAVPFAWRLWEFAWKAPAKAGTVKLAARATDSAGNVQPAERNADYRNYMIHHRVPVEVVVR